VRLYGLRMWVEQSYKHVKHALGWSQYRVRSDKAIRRHWQLACCAFSFCWYHASHLAQSPVQADPQVSEVEVSPPLRAPDAEAETGGKNRHRTSNAAPPLLASSTASGTRLALSLDHAASRYWSGWSEQPPPPVLQRLFHWLESGHALALYSSA
jgi:hypothetical protein